MASSNKSMRVGGGVAPRTTVSNVPKQPAPASQPAGAPSLKARPTITARLVASDPSPAGAPLQSGNGAPMGNNQEFGDQWMSRHNSYLATLRDPVAVTGVGIPNGLSPRTTTMQVVIKQLLQTNENGVCGVIMGYNGASNNVAANDPAYWVPQSIATDGSPIAWTCGTGSSPSVLIGESFGSGHDFIDADSIRGFLQSYTTKVRVVSAAINLQPAVGFEKADGTYIAGSLPPNYFNSRAYGPGVSDFATLQNTTGTIWAPIYNPKSPGVTAVYTPTDESCQVFTNATKTQVNYTDADYNAVQPSVMFAFASQAATDNGANHMLQIVINYEMELKTSVLSFGARTVLNDPLALATAYNGRMKDPLAFVGSDMFSQSPSSIGHRGSMDAPGVQCGHMFSARLVPHQVRAPRLLSFGLDSVGRVSCKMSKAQAVQEVEEEQPLFESLVDTVGSIVKRGLPNLLPFLKKL